MKSFFSGIKQVLLWSYQRGSWQYDLLCILILAFIFFTPSDWFNPEPEEIHPRLEQAAPEFKRTEFDSLSDGERGREETPIEKNPPKP